MIIALFPGWVLDYDSFIPGTKPEALYVCSEKGGRGNEVNAITSYTTWRREEKNLTRIF